MAGYSQYKKYDIPWYASDTICLILIVIMAFIFIFGLIGLNVSQTIPEYNEMKIIPLALSFLSVFIMLTTIIRLIRRIRLSSRTKNRLY